MVDLALKNNFAFCSIELYLCIPFLVAVTSFQILCGIWKLYYGVGVGVSILPFNHINTVTNFEMDHLERRYYTSLFPYWLGWEKWNCNLCGVQWLTFRMISKREKKRIGLMSDMLLLQGGPVNEQFHRRDGRAVAWGWAAGWGGAGYPDSQGPGESRRRKPRGPVPAG